MIRAWEIEGEAPLLLSKGFLKGLFQGGQQNALVTLFAKRPLLDHQREFHRSQFHPNPERCTLNAVGRLAEWMGKGQTSDK